MRWKCQKKTTLMWNYVNNFMTKRTRTSLYSPSFPFYPKIIEASWPQRYETSERQTVVYPKTIEQATEKTVQTLNSKVYITLMKHCWQCKQTCRKKKEMLERNWQFFIWQIKIFRVDECTIFFISIQTDLDSNK